MPYNYTTNGGIAYEELEGSPTYQATSDGFSATQVYRMAWASIDAFLLESFPVPVRAGFAYEFTLERTFPGTSWLFTRSVRIEGFDPGMPSAGTQFNTYATGARVTIEYGTRPREEQDGTLRTHRLSIGGIHMIMPSRGFGWWNANGGADPVPASFMPIQSEDVRVAKVLPTIEHTLSFEYVPDPPFTTITDRVGKTNQDTDLFSATRGTLLFLGADMHRRVTPQGEQAWKIEYRFSQKVIKGPILHLEAPPVNSGDGIGWNYEYNPKEAQWDVLVDKNDKYMYQEATFAELFQAEGAV